MKLTKSFYLYLSVFVAVLGLVTCGGESPLPSSMEQAPGANDSIGAEGQAPFASSMKGGQSKITICHIPPGNPANAHTITVGEPAVRAHVENHGDTLGACQPEPPSECLGQCSDLDDLCCSLRADCTFGDGCEPLPFARHSAGSASP
jgi:hypothetical protein